MDNLRKTLARNLREFMENSETMDTQQAVAKESGIAQSHISKLLRAKGNLTLDKLEDLAGAFGRQAWELLADGPEARAAAWERLVSGETPRKEAVHKRVKKSGGNRESDSSVQ